jgi:ABC-type multidrug transport system fused ATPase/permease subunit
MSENRPHESCDDRALIYRMLRLGWRYRAACVVVVALHIALVVLNLSGLGLTGIGIDFIRHQVTSSGRAPSWPFGIAPPADWSALSIVTAIAAAVLALALLNAVVRYVTAIAVAYLSQRVLIQLRSDVYAKLQRLSFQFFDGNDSSSIINRAAGDVQAVRTFVDGVIVKVLTVFLTLIVYLVYMLKVHVTLTIACLVTTPLLWCGAVIFSRLVQPAYRRSSELGDRMVSTLVENVQGIQVVKGFAREREEIARFRAANERIRDQKFSIFWTISTYQPVMGFLTQLNMIVLLAYGGSLVVRGDLQLGAGLFVFANLLHEFANQVGQITNIANTIQSSLAGAQRVFEVLDAPVTITSAPNAVRLPRVRGAVRFDRVSFEYEPGKPVLSGVSFTVRPGECIGIVGETGAGKSTLLSLLSRFYDVSSGSVMVDNIDVRRLDLDNLRRSIGVIFQESFLFSNTVSANIAFGHPEATLHEIERAARIAAAHEFIEELPQGYDTVVGEYGSNLSGGQRQRLAIARALLLDPPILVLDDATASVDSHTEREIQHAMESAMYGRTTFIVSNRLSALRRTDRILVLEDGSIAQSGAHAELLRARGYYRRLAILQFTDIASGSASALPDELPAETAEVLHHDASAQSPLEECA